MRSLSQLRFSEDELTPRMRAKLAESVKDRENEDENVAGDAARQGERSSEAVLRLQSRSRQKLAIKHQYAKDAAKAAREGADAGTEVGSFVERAVAKIKKGADSIRRNPKAFLILLAIFLALSMLLNMASTGAMFFQGLGSVIGSTTYPARDADILAAEREYSALEDALRNLRTNYEDTHTYDRYDFDLDEIGHDPYVLISILTALRGGEWTIAEVRGTLQWLFSLQYEITESISVEQIPDPDDPEAQIDYVSVYVKLTNKRLSRLPCEFMTERQLSMYSMYMATLGNRPDLFPGSEYIGRYGEGSFIRYEIPPEALADESFAAMVREAEKYLGYPYVWGGSSPSTSFDCSGFVCWVINHCGWNAGRTTAQGLCNYCTPVRASDARPGDLVFFIGTYDTPEVSHVGIYVGNNMMIHCGDPISYSNLNSVYWQQHLYCYGRLP